MHQKAAAQPYLLFGDRCTEKYYYINLMLHDAVIRFLSI